ncbi:MAG: hypothetical protein WAQ28_20720 [Bacteroidia bacterium]|jgi:hypothetical protein
MERKKNFITSITSSFFLKKVTPLPSTMQLLRDMYPTVNWDRVDFYEGLPWYTPYLASYVNAQALPQFYSFNRFSIYLRKFDESRIQNVSDIVHEAFHVLQGMRFWNGYGIGILRGFTIYYGAVFFKYGYRNNPFEITAYDHEFRFLDFCEKHHQHGIVPEADPTIFKYVNAEKTLVYKRFDFKYKEGTLLLIACLMVSLLATIIKPIIDVLVYILRLFTPRPQIH